MTRPNSNGAFLTNGGIPLFEFARVASLDTEPSSFRQRVLQALRGHLLDEDLAHPIQSLIESGADRTLRIAAIDALSIDANRTTVDLLFQLADHDPDPKVRSTAFLALRIPEGDARVLPFYSKTLRESEDETSRQWAALLLGTAQAKGIEDAGASSSVVELLCYVSASDGSALVRAAAVCSLADCVDRRALGQIIQTVQADPDATVRLSALDALVRSAAKVPAERDRVLQVLRGAVNDVDPTVSKKATQHLDQEVWIQRQR